MTTTDLTYYLTTYTGDRGVEYEAVQIPWPKVTHLLGGRHDGTAEDDQELIDFFAGDDAPDWWHGREGGIVEGWTDEHGWGVYGGPAINNEDDDAPEVTR